MSKMTSVPGGMDEHSPEWHHEKFVDFTKNKLMINEPSPHLRMVGHITQNYVLEEKLWMLGCYAATYNLPGGQVIFMHWSVDDILRKPKTLLKWLEKNWKGIITRTERRCVRSPKNMAQCLISCAEWIDTKYDALFDIQASDEHDYYNQVYNSVTGIRYFGRYISIRFIEGLRRFCDIPAMLYDVRSVGGWSPKRCMMYLRPEYIDNLRMDDAKNNAIMDKLTEELLASVKIEVPNVDSYVLAAMLCEYKGAFENRHQYVGQTLDQKFKYMDKTVAYWGNDFDQNLIWGARKAIFPWQTLGEIGNRWHEYRLDVASILRDHGYVWSDLLYDYVATKNSGDFSKPVRIRQ